MRKLSLLLTTLSMATIIAQTEIAPGPILQNEDANNVSVFENVFQRGTAAMEATAFQRWFDGGITRNTIEVFAARHTGGDILNEGDSWFPFIVKDGLNPVSLDQITFYAQASTLAVWRVEARPTSSDPWITVSISNFTFLDNSSATDLVPTVIELDTTGNSGQGYSEYRLILAETWSIPDRNFDLIGEVEFRATPISTTLSTEDFSNVSNIETFPNPTSNLLNFGNLNNLDIVSVNLIDVSGKTVFIKKNENLNTIDVSEFPSGLYIVELTLENGDTAIKKIVIN